MDHRPRESRPVELTRPLALPEPLPPAVLAELRSFGKRRQLERSGVYAAHVGRIDAITRALAYGRPADPAPRAGRAFVRVASWNIERGLNLDGIKAYLCGHPVLSEIDVLLLNEVDAGMARTRNRHVAREIAEALGFEWVFGNSYLVLSHGNVRDGRPDQENALGLHGNAILSRFPILRAENISVAVTKDKFSSSEKRLGHKKALWAEIDTPRGKLPICTVHLDSGASPAQRRDQLRDALRVLEERGVAERALIGGDFNTTTYDLKSIPRLLRNIFSKLLRGGFPHAIHHYVHPYKLYEREIFEELRARGFEYAPFNAMGVGTTRYEVGTFDSESKVRDYLPEIAVKILRWKLKPWNGVAPLKIDWFSGRGIRSLGAAEMKEAGGRVSIAPAPIAKPRHEGTLLSDHDPIVVDLAF